MNTGIGFTEILVIVTLVLLFFGSKELPRFIREAARVWGKAKGYSDKFRRELSEISREIDVSSPRSHVNPTVAAKKELRKTFRKALAALPEEQKRRDSSAIIEHCLNSDEIMGAGSVMVYLNMPSEVSTDSLVAQLFKMGKRVLIPYCKPQLHDLGIAEITDRTADTVVGALDILEPRHDLRDNFLKSDLGAVICPGLGFDFTGGRLGRGKGYYDNFLRELRGRIPLMGLAFSCQITHEPFPFDYHDVSLDQIFTPDGPIVKPVATLAHGGAVSP